MKVTPTSLSNNILEKECTGKEHWVAKKEGRGCQEWIGMGSPFQVEQLCPGVLCWRAGKDWVGVGRDTIPESH